MRSGYLGEAAAETDMLRRGCAEASEDATAVRPWSFTHILTRAGRHSLAVVIPKEFLKKLRWKAKQRVTVKLRGKTVEIRDWKPKRKR